MSEDVTYYLRLAKEYQAAKDASEVYKKRADKMRVDLIHAVNSFGFEDDKHHRWIEGEELNIKYERRVTKRLDLEAVESWAKESGVWDRIMQTIEVVDEDKLMGLAWEDPEVAKIVQSLYVETENFALKVLDV